MSNRSALRATCSVGANGRCRLCRFQPLPDPSRYREGAEQAEEVGMIDAVERGGLGGVQRSQALADQISSTEIDRALARLRVALLEEEVGEFVAASEQGDLVGIADALADIVYVVYGTALTYGIDLDAVLREVHRSNMSKLGRDGEPLIREDGKVLKSETYFPPDIASVLGLPPR
jgi:NTP pyrophosphatase (non-canonical NTP hydrolase)